MRALAPDARITVYPNALPEIAAPERLEREEIAFSGNLEYRAQYRSGPVLSRSNLAGAAVAAGIEVEDRAARIRKRSASWWHGDPRIEVTGSVPDAVESWRLSQVAVVPLLSGSGTRVKILEAWAAAHSRGVDYIRGGRPGNSGEHLLLADDPDGFAAAVARLLDSPAERRRLGSAGRRLFEQRYTWPAAWECLGNLLETGPPPP